MNIIPEEHRNVARGATAIWLILESLPKRTAKVLVPSNICYAAIYPILYSGSRPVFCDVDGKTGNVTKALVEDALRKHKIDCAIFPHMYGNPIDEFPEIVEVVHQVGGLVIEDCASSMGAQYCAGGYVGHMGDYSVYSTGYSKTIELGFGGIVASGRRPLSEIDFSLLDRLPLFNEEMERREKLFSKIYRCIRNERIVTAFESSIFRGLASPLRDIFLCRITNDQEKVIENALTALPDVAARRRQQYMSYCCLIGDLPKGVMPYPMASGAVPWRWSCLVDPKRRQDVIDASLELGMPISDWYPCVSGYFGDCGTYSNAEIMGSSIINLPLLIDDEELKRNARNFKAVLEDCFA